MHNAIRWLLVWPVVVLMVVGTTQMSAAQTTNDQALQIARQAIADLVKGDFDAVYKLFDSDLTAALTEDKLKAGWGTITTIYGTYQSEISASVADSSVYKVVTLELKFSGGVAEASIPVDQKGLLYGLSLHGPPKPTVAAPLAADEQEVTFKSNSDTFYGTLLIPANGKGKIPAVLLISGSGPTDRDGNSTLLSGRTDSHKSFARILADAGIASFRYDKYTTGKTGLGSFAMHLADLTFDDYVTTALAGYAYLGSRSEVDPSKVAILGHSEGGLIALVAAQQAKVAPAALLLMAPLSKPYLDTIREQVAAQLAAVVKTGQATPADADKTLAELDQIIAQIEKDGTTPATMSEQWASVFAPVNLKFLQTASRYDAATIAQTLPKTLNVLIICGQKDSQVPCADVQLLADGFAKGGATNAQFYLVANMDHVFKVVTGTPNPTVDYTDPTKPFSPEAAQHITDFVKTALVGDQKHG